MALKEPTALPPTKADADGAVDRIYQRRRRAGDDDLHHFSHRHYDAVEYVRIWRRVGPDVLAADALDALVIIRYLGYQLECDQLAMIEVCRKRRPGTRRLHWSTWKALAPYLGVTTAQAAHRRMQSIRAMKTRVRERDRYATRNPSVVWSDGRSRGHLTRSRPGVVEAATALLAHRDELARNDDAADYLAGIEELLEDLAGRGGPADASAQRSLLAYFALLSTTLNESPAGAEKCSPDAVRALAQAAALETAHTRAIAAPQRRTGTPQPPL